MVRLEGVFGSFGVMDFRVGCLWWWKDVGVWLADVFVNILISFI